jgi:hypothetical protein
MFKFSFRLLTFESVVVVLREEFLKAAVHNAKFISEVRVVRVGKGKGPSEHHIEPTELLDMTGIDLSGIWRRGGESIRAVHHGTAAALL